MLSATVGPWNLSAGGSLRVVVDSGNFVVERDHLTGSFLEEVLVPGDFTVTLPDPATPAGAAALAALFANPANATAAEVVSWLNGDTATFDYNEREFRFGDRAIAYVDEATGKLAIRTRALGSSNPSAQIPDATKGLGIFTSTAVAVPGSAVQLRQRTDTVKNPNDPKLSWTTGSLAYELDPVDDLVPGTYMINVEFADRGRGATSDSYRTPSIAVATFQVKQEAVEKPIADGCTRCHWSSDEVGQGVGFTLDFPRHNKPFNAQALDQCGGCHNYKSGETVAARTWTTGGGTKPIGKRVHAVHRGANLVYPVITVDHEDTTMGRAWQITYPQDIRNCESCHPMDIDAKGKLTKISGTWLTNPNRIACMGCHDTDAATAHMRLQVYDPTPTAPWSGDESEACATCH